MTPSKGFAGFPEGRIGLTPIPNPFFSELLPAIDHLGELKLTLYAFWALARKEGAFRYLRGSDMAQDALLLQALAEDGLEPKEALQEALERTVARGTLLKVVIQGSAGEAEQLFFLNSAKGRAAVAAIEAGEWVPSGVPDAPVRLAHERPNIYTLYEQNIGALTPMIAERLREAEKEYPPEWIEDAMRIAVENNVRKWRYVEAILEDWQQRGRDEREDRGDTEKARRRYLQGRFADFWEGDEA
ncbi:MAG TPA: DnaD domain protein [Chloroflexi bacterium]|nr:DnaD domain protein [Chloroflexota bacterium]